MLSKLSAVKKFVALKLKKTTMKIDPETIGRTPRFPDLTLSRARRGEPASRAAPPRGALSCPTTSASAVLTAVPVAVVGIPETFVGSPAVIASTTSCCVVFARS